MTLIQTRYGIVGLHFTDGVFTLQLAPSCFVPNCGTPILSVDDANGLGNSVARQCYTTAEFPLGDIVEGWARNQQETE